MNIDDILKNGESETIEFKTRVIPPQMLARIISAFSNTEGGTILLGIQEPNSVIGVEPEKFERTYQRAVQHVTGGAKTSSEIIEYQNKKIGVIAVEKASTPVGSTEGYFTRVGGMDRSLGLEQLKQLFTKDIGVNNAVESLSQTVSKQTDEIGKLRESFEQANSWKRKFFYAFLGALATGIAKLLLTTFGIVIG